MEKDKTSGQPFDFLVQKDYYFKTFSSHHIVEVQDDFNGFHRKGYFDETFYNERLTFFKFDSKKITIKNSFIVVIAVPQPIIKVKFNWMGRDVPVYIPPTYDVTINSIIKEQLKKRVKPIGYDLEPLFIPLKTFAVRSGLAEYGRNNICYIPGVGSFFRLLAFVTDLPNLPDNWRNPKVMERCKKCRACILACPTDTISDERFIIHAERCLTYLNERLDPFPKNITLEAHNCIIGCMHCQNICPENKKVIEWIEESEKFSEDETARILGGFPIVKLPEQTKRKLDRLCLTDEYNLLSRNLSVLLDIYENKENM